jgi:hypothetical protein
MAVGIIQKDIGKHFRLYNDESSSIQVAGFM